MSFKSLDTRQVVNRSALSNIGSAANTSLDVILEDINNALASVSSNTGYDAKTVSLTSGSTSIVITIPEQPDLSYVVIPTMVNLVDSTPQFQQVEVTNKTLTGFTFQWNVPLSSN